MHGINDGLAGIGSSPRVRGTRARRRRGRDGDRIIPARYLRCVTFDGLGAHAFEDDRKQDPAHPFNDERYSKGRVLISGRNFGCGSSREQAPQALQAAGVGAVVVGSAARIFYRNAINVGLPIIICLEAARILESGDVAQIDLEAGTVRNARTGQEVCFSPPPEFLRDILGDGGLVPHLRKRLHSR